MAWPPWVAVTLKVVPAVPDPSSTQTVAKATVLVPPALTVIGLLNDDELNAATGVFALLSVTLPVEPSVNIICARETEPTAVSVNFTFRSCASVVNQRSEIFPLASAVILYGPCASISGDSTSWMATASPGFQPLPVMLTVVPGG